MNLQELDEFNLELYNVFSEFSQKAYQIASQLIEIFSPFVNRNKVVEGNTKQKETGS